MGSEQDDEVKKAQIVETRARNISHNVRCTECGSQSIEDSQADVAILLRKVIVLLLSQCISALERLNNYYKFTDMDVIQNMIYLFIGLNYLFGISNGFQTCNIYDKGT